MNHIFIDILPSALGIIVSPLSIVAMILVLTSDKAKVNGFAFLCGWILAVFIVGFAGLNLIDLNQNSEQLNKIVLLAQLFAGILLLFLAGKNWMSRPKGNKVAKVPRWMPSVNKMNWLSTVGLAFFLGGLNLKNLALILGGVSA